MKWIAGLFICLTFSGCVGEETENQTEPHVSEESTQYKVQTNFYNLDNQLIQGQFGAYLVELEGKTYEPDRENAPLVLVMHGRHGTCNVVGIEQLIPVCPETPLTSQVESHLGYNAIGHSLAEKGFFVASVDANGVNDLDNNWGLLGDDYGASARVAVLQAHYEYLMDTYSLSGEVGLIGHSRGGEAVNLAATTLNPTPRAIFSIAPTDFADHHVEQVPFLVLLPECDGDVRDLQGKDVYARGLANGGQRYQVWVQGANHNFFNTVWTGDDAQFTYNGGLCTTESHRLSMQSQSNLGAQMATSFFMKHMQGQDDGALEPMQCAWNCPTETHLVRNFPGRTPFDFENCSQSSVFVKQASNLYVECNQPDWNWTANALPLVPEYSLRVNDQNYTQFLTYSDDPSYKPFPRTLQFEGLMDLHAKNVQLTQQAKE